MKKKLVIVSGGMSGIGFSIVNFLISKNYNVISLDIKKTKINNTSKLKFVRCDITSIKKIKKEISKINNDKEVEIIGLINCAGITITKNSLNYNLKDWNKTIATNLTAPFFLTQEIVRCMIKNKTKGSIINFTSISSELAMPDNPAYNSSKAGLKHLTKSLAVDFSKFGIRINNISPGYTKTKMTKKSWKDLALRKKRSSRTLMNRWANSSEYNEAVLFLLDNKKSSYITGQDFIIDGGWTIKGL